MSGFALSSTISTDELRELGWTRGSTEGSDAVVRFNGPGGDYAEIDEAGRVTAVNADNLAVVALLVAWGRLDETRSSHVHD